MVSRHVESFWSLNGKIWVRTQETKNPDSSQNQHFQRIAIVQHTRCTVRLHAWYPHKKDSTKNTVRIISFLPLVGCSYFVRPRRIKGTDSFKFNKATMVAINGVTNDDHHRDRHHSGADSDADNVESNNNNTLLLLLLRQRIDIQNSIIKELQTKLALTKSQQALEKLEDMLLNNDLRTTLSSIQQQQSSRRRQTATTQRWRGTLGHSHYDDGESNDDDDDSSDYHNSNDATYNHYEDYGQHNSVVDDDSDISFSTCSVTTQESAIFSTYYSFKSTLFQQEWTTTKKPHHNNVDNSRNIEWITPYICKCQQKNDIEEQQQRTYMTCLYTKQRMMMSGGEGGGNRSGGGLYTVSINLKGIGVSFVGLIVSSSSSRSTTQQQEEQDDLYYYTSEDLMRGKLTPYIMLLPGSGDRTVTLNIDTINRKAEVYVTKTISSSTTIAASSSNNNKKHKDGNVNFVSGVDIVGKRQPDKIWNDIQVLPVSSSSSSTSNDGGGGNISVVVAVKCNTPRQITLLPCTYWEV